MDIKEKLASNAVFNNSLVLSTTSLILITWSPDFVETSQDGTIGYTYGNYTWQSKDSSGKVNEAKGVFHTVWKKQKDGSWKYVWD